MVQLHVQLVRATLPYSEYRRTQWIPDKRFIGLKTQDCRLTVAQNSNIDSSVSASSRTETQPITFSVSNAVQPSIIEYSSNHVKDELVAVVKTVSDGRAMYVTQRDCG